MAEAEFETLALIRDGDRRPSTAQKHAVLNFRRYYTLHQDSYSTGSAETDEFVLVH